MKTSNVEIKNAAWIGASCFIAYMACYGGKNILSAVMPQLIGEGVFTSESLGRMGSAFFFLYGVGQLINGILGNKISAKSMVGIGLFLAGLLIMFFPMLTSVKLGIIVWGISGFLCSMLWGPISKMIGSNTSGKVAKFLLTFMTIASIAGTSITYLIAIYSSSVQNWKAAFYISGLLLMVISAMWFVVNIYMERKNIVKEICKTNEIKHDKKSIVKQFLNLGFISMLIVTMLNGVIRNAVTFWIPTFLSDNFGIDIKLVAAISSILPIVNIFGTFFTLYALKWVKNDEKTMCMILFAVSAFLFSVVYFCNERFAFLAVSALFIANSAMMGASNMIFSVYVLRFVHTGKISGITGLLDFSSYMSASITSIIFANVLANINWNAVVGIWVGITAMGVVFSWIAKRNTMDLIGME